MKFNKRTFRNKSRRTVVLLGTTVGLVGLVGAMDRAMAFVPTVASSKKLRRRPMLLFSDPVDQSNRPMPLHLEVNVETDSHPSELEERSSPTIASLVGIVDDQRILFPELSSGEVPRMFSSLVYKKSEDGTLSATHAAGSTVGATALVAGTTVGAGILALPTATAGSGFVPSTVGMTIAWALMTMSGLLIAELSMNRFGETGRPGLGLLDLYESKLGKAWGVVGSVAYFFLHYAMMVAYIAQGGTNFDGFLRSVGLQSLVDIHGSSQLWFAGICWLAMYTAEQSLIEKVNNILVVGVFASFLGILSLGAGSADFEALLNSVNQHPEAVVNSFPILFLSLVYQNVVPTVVAQLEGDRSKVSAAISVGTTIPFVMFVAWNAVILGNVLGVDAPSDVDPVTLLQRSGDGEILSTLVGMFSELALVTSLIGFVYGLLDAITDVTGLPSEGPKFQKWKPWLFAGVFLPPLALSASNPEIFYKALDYGGAFGVSTLFLVLPPIMVWKSRYVLEESGLMTKPMVPMGKIPLVIMLAAAGALIIQQVDEKFEVSNFVQTHWMASS
jgi:tyrosine-specific transport protein